MFFIQTFKPMRLYLQNLHQDKTQNEQIIYIFKKE